MPPDRSNTGSPDDWLKRARSNLARAKLPVRLSTNYLLSNHASDHNSLSSTAFFQFDDKLMYPQRIGFI
jgi:hypothetical protein